MRKAQKEQAIELIGLLGRAHEGIRMTIETGQREETLNLLEQCQDVAIHLGEDIEREEGEGAPTVTLLEEYCEAVYQVYEKLSQGQAVNGHKAYKTLRKSLIQIENSVKVSKVRIEAVFLPYKASMWDSLESVWKAAQEDPDCDAYVIPIPYFDKNPDGSFLEEHYEADLYPDDVPVTGYHDYDFAERRPDFIFIHNPYDECNYVTSVHPFFYAKNLKQFTDKLVYIPYFILGEVDPEDEDAVKGMEHFCTVPGVLYADRVIVQSEDMKKIYVNVMTEYTKKTAMDRNYWDRKILGLGSPKVDKALRTRKDEVEVPEEWKKIIKKEDGSWKKIVFYNTGVTALLRHGEDMLEKIDFVFRIFKDRQKEVTLLWRPHPLVDSTIKAMRPKLWNRYKDIVEKYGKERWGIYDDSANLNRAIAISDVYYGDGSSVANLFQKDQKQVILQNVWCPRIENWQKSIRVSNGAVIDETDLWLVSNYANTLLQYDMTNGNLKEVFCFPEQVAELYFSVSFIKVKDEFFFAPYNACNLWRFHVKKKCFKKVDLKLKGQEKSRKRKFGIILHYNQEILLIGHEIKCIYSLNLLTDELRRHDGYLGLLEERGICGEAAIFGYDYQVVDGLLYLPLIHSNLIVIFDLENHQFSLQKIENLETQGFDAIDYKDGMFRLTNCNDEEITWAPGQGTVSKRGLGFLKSELKSYRLSFHYKNAYIYFSELEKKIGIRREEGEIQEIPFSYPEAEIFPDGIYSKFTFVKRVKERIYFQVRSNGDCFYIDLEKMMINPFRLEVPGDVHRELIGRIFRSNAGQTITESEIVNIATYLQFGQQYQNSGDRLDEYYGKTVYTVLRSED